MDATLPLRAGPSLVGPPREAAPEMAQGRTRLLVLRVYSLMPSMTAQDEGDTVGRDPT